jgi:signal transduction histidine kinase
MKKILELILQKTEYFLPANLKDSVSIIDYYRARIIVSVDAISSIIVLFLLIASGFGLNLPFAVFCSVVSSFIFLVLSMFYLKNIKQNFMAKFQNFTIFQVVFITSIILYSAYSEFGTGIFGLVWIFPVVFMTVFLVYNSAKNNLFIILIMTLLALIFWHYDDMLNPISKVPNFKMIFIVFLFLSLILVFCMSLIFTELSEELKDEINNQRELLIESAKFNSLGQMASTLAHDINNPLFILQGKLHLIKNLLSNDKLDIAKCDEIVENSEVIINKLSELVRGISNYARLGRVEDMLIMDVGQLVDNSLVLCTAQFEKRNVNFYYDYPTKVDVICHPSFFSQIILNLINNAMDAVENSQHKEIKLKIKIADEKIRIIVEDNGPGIPNDLKDKIFQPFFTTKHMSKGTGLGLSISKGLAELHHGKIYYHRQNDLTHFVFELPNADSQMSDH